MFQLRVWQMDLTGRLGLALSHPLYIVLCRAFATIIPGDFAWRVNLFSALCSAGAIGLLFATIRRLSRSQWTAFVTVGLLAVTHTFWTHAVIAEVYGLYALLLALEMYLLVRYCHAEKGRPAWWLLALMLVNGLNVSNHLLALLHLPAYGIYALLRIRAKRLPCRFLILMALAWIVGAGLYEALIIAQIARGAGVADTIRSALFGLQWQDRVIGCMPDSAVLGKSLGYFLLNFPTPILLLAPLGIYFGLRDSHTRPAAAVWLGICTVAFVFALRYDVPDQYVFFFPCYVFTAVFIGLGAGRMPQARPLMASVPARIAILLLTFLPALAYEIAPAAASGIPRLRPIADKALRAERAIPGRDIYTYFLRPRKNGDYSARNFALAALELAHPDGLIAADTTTANPIIYLQQTQGQYSSVYLSKGPDLKAPREVVADVATVESWLALGRRVFIVSPQRQSALAEDLEQTNRFRLEPRDPLYEILPAERPDG
ncbi:MAG: DUF2723 domain-containing protein [Desulfobacteraceae bacterium]|nr:DUF2723 domain-containing protein [Desulfobacteraceae bacterium]